MATYTKRRIQNVEKPGVLKLGNQESEYLQLLIQKQQRKFGQPKKRQV